MMIIKLEDRDCPNCKYQYRGACDDTPACRKCLDDVVGGSWRTQIWEIHPSLLSSLEKAVLKIRKEKYADNST